MKKSTEETKRKMSKAQRLKQFKDQNILEFMRNHNVENELKFDQNAKMKLTSSDEFKDSIESLSKSAQNSDYPVVIGQVSGFFETATLAGLLANNCKEKTKPSVLFFDKNPNNIQNALWNTLLINSCETREEYLTNVFQLSEVDIVMIFLPKEYEKVVNKVLKENPKLNIEDMKSVNEYIVKNYFTPGYIKEVLSQKFSFTKLENYLLMKTYDKEAHLDQLLKLAKPKLSKEMYSLFEELSKNMCEHFSQKEHFSDHIGYLLKDIKRNKETHILDNEKAFNGFKTLINKNGTGNIKFLPGVDISKVEGLLKLESSLKQENIISDDIKQNEFPIDISVIPHIRRLKDTFPFFKKNSQYFVETNRDELKRDDSGKVLYSRTTALHIPDYDKIGANFIEEELRNQTKLEYIKPMEALDGFPNIASMAGINFGYIYTSYTDLQNIIDNAKADKVHTMFIQSLIYSEHKRYQTKRRNLTDPKYPTLDSRLKAAKALVEDLNASGMNVIYQIGDEDINLRDELFYTYFFKELKQVGNFLKREDMDEKYDWAKEIISDDLIPYLIRSGKDITTYYNEKGEKKTRIGDICSYISAVKNGTPLGNLSKLVDENGNKLIDESYFKNRDNFEVVNEKRVNFDRSNNLSDNNNRLSVDMIANPNFSKDTQYSSPEAGIVNRIKIEQSGANKYGNNSQVLLDSRQSHMGANIIGGRFAQMAITTPQLTADDRYLRQDFLAGKKQVNSDSVHKRINLSQKRMNFPGSWTWSGDLDWIFKLNPYWRRSREVQEHVQKTGQGLPNIVELHINDIQLGSITERIATFLKLIDIAMYKYGANVVTFLGDHQQGWNYQRFAVESRHTAGMSVGQQSVDFVKLERPWIKSMFGVVSLKLFESSEEFKVDEELSTLIVDYLYEGGYLERKFGEYGYVNCIKRDIDYDNLNLNLPERLKPYEEHIKRRLRTVRLVYLFKLAEGNHEKNSDWSHKGYKPVDSIVSELESFKMFSGSDVDIKYAEFIINNEGDYIEGSYCYSEINGYNTLSAHNLRAPFKGSGGSATRSMANWSESQGIEYKNIDIFEQGHLHNFEMSVLNGKLYTVIPGIAGQSGFEQMLGYASHPRGMMKIYKPDGRIEFELISSNFIDNWQVMNPEVAAIGLENHIRNTLAQEAVIISGDMPKQIHQPDQRTLKPAQLTRKLGPSIPR